MFNPPCSALVPAGSTVVLPVPLLVRSVPFPEARPLAFHAPLLQFVAALRVAVTAVGRRLFALADSGSALVLFVFSHAGERRKKQAAIARKRAASAARSARC